MVMRSWSEVLEGSCEDFVFWDGKFGANDLEDHRLQDGGCWQVWAVQGGGGVAELPKTAGLWGIQDRVQITPHLRGRTGNGRGWGVKG